ncbi:Hpt domain-containing protein [Massilia sp. DWR3-1-1]|uniref:Hpt domain-containing protein n=1 Tax=Massilia sp. DWR3-1-1 TaxID=2804559 RepID=UPI003CEE8322
MPHDHCGDPRAADAALLDTGAATARVLGDGALYLRMLRRFRHDYPPGAHGLHAAIASADLPLAQRLAHTLMGSAGMIGAHQLHQRADALEQHLRTHGAHGAGGPLAGLEHALGAVLLVVEGLLDGDAAADGTAPGQLPAPPPESALALLQLAALLDAGDGAALDLLEQAGPVLQEALGEAAYGEVMLAVNAFDFERALASLRRAPPAAGLTP